MTRRTRRDPPTCTDAHTWLRTNGHYLAGLTGQDARALSAIAHCWQLYASGDAAAEHAAILSVTALTTALQPQYRMLARELIAHSMDWDDRARLWPRVEAMIATWTHEARTNARQLPPSTDARTEGAK